MGVGLQVLHLLLFHKAFCLLKFRFSCASTNFSFKGVIEGPSTTFNFPMSSLKLRLYCPCRVFCVFVCRIFLGQKVLVSSRGHEHRSLMVFLGFVVSGLLDLQRGISFVFWLIPLYLYIYIFFLCRMVRGHEEASTSQAWRKRGTPGNAHSEQPRHCYVYRGLEVLQTSPLGHQIRDVKRHDYLDNGSGR